MATEVNFNNKPANTESGILAMLWRKILIESGILPGITFLINRYLARTKTESDTIKKKNRSTLISDITATQMSWKTFTDLLFSLLNVKKVEFIVKVHWETRVTTHSATVLPSSVNNEDPIEKIKEEQDEKNHTAKDSKKDSK